MDYESMIYLITFGEARDHKTLRLCVERYSKDKRQLLGKTNYRKYIDSIMFYLENIDVDEVKRQNLYSDIREGMLIGGFA